MKSLYYQFGIIYKLEIYLWIIYFYFSSKNILYNFKSRI